MTTFHGAREPVLWRVVKIGVKNKQEMRSSLKSEAFLISKVAAQALENLKLATSTEQIKLYRISGSTFGMGLNFPRQALVARARRAGYELCPAEVAYYLVMAYENLPYSDSLIVASNPILVDRGGEVLFKVTKFLNTCTLVTVPCGPNAEFDSKTKFIFKRR